MQALMYTYTHITILLYNVHCIHMYIVNVYIIFNIHVPESFLVEIPVWPFSFHKVHPVIMIIN